MYAKSRAMLIRNSSNNFQTTTTYRKIYDRKKLKALPIEEVRKIATQNGVRIGNKSKMRLIDEISNYSNCF